MRRVSLTAALLAGAAGSAAFGQETNTAPEGSLLSATVSERVTADSNYRLDDPSPGTSYYADTRLSLGYSNNTPTSTFELGIDTGLRALWEAEQSFEFTLASPTSANLGYTNEWANGLFDATLRYRQRQADTTEFIDDPDNPGSLQQLQGNTREMRYDANIGVVWGTSSPSSYGLRFLGTAFNYSDDTADQVARYTAEGLGNWNLQLTPVLSSVVLLDVLHYSADDDVSTELNTDEITAGLAYAPSENLTVQGTVGYAVRKKTQDAVPPDTGRDTTQDNSGATLLGDFTYTTESLTFLGNVRLTEAAPETQLSGALRAVYALPRGQLSGRVFQNYTSTDTGGQEAQVTGVGVGLVHDINAVSSIGLDVNYAVQSDVYTDNPGPDIHRTNFTATYSHALTDVINADVGYRFRNREEDPDNASSNAVFFQIGRTFETTP